MTVLMVERTGRQTAGDLDPAHLVCHCTDDNIAACGLDVTDEPWTDGPDEDDCPLCVLAWPDDAPCCPWGCRCDDCGRKP